MFLPSFCQFLLALALLLAAACDRRGAGRVPAPVATDPRVTVVAGAGDVDAEWVERTRAVVAAELPDVGHWFPSPKHVFFVHVHADRDTLPPALAACLQPESPAFTLLGQHQIHLVWGEMRRLGEELPRVVRHELVHELLDQATFPHSNRIPRWFHEGLAQHIAGGTYLGAREQDLVWRLMLGRLPSCNELRERFAGDVDALRLAYALSYSYVAWLAREHGEAALLAAARAVDDYTSFESALAGRLGRNTLQLEDGWRDYLLHGSGAPWRSLMQEWFSLVMVAVLPLLVIAVGRRLAREGRTARLLAERDARLAAEAAAAAELAAAVAANGAPIVDPAAPAGAMVETVETIETADDRSPGDSEEPPAPPVAPRIAN